MAWVGLMQLVFNPIPTPVSSTEQALALPFKGRGEKCVALFTLRNVLRISWAEKGIYR